MPQLLRSLSRFSLFRRVPIPTLKNYMVVSTILSIGVFYHTYRTVTSDDWKDQNEQPADNENGTQLSPGTQQLLNSSLLFKILYVLVTDQTTVWVVVNSVCCAAATFGWVLRWFVFGRLRVQETQQLRDRFWNFVFHKFVFVFGVLNATYVDEVVLWTFWFMSVGLVYLLTSLAQDRFKYMSSAAPASNPSVQYRLVVMASCCCLAALGLLVVSIAGWYKFGAHYGLFLMAEVGEFCGIA
uniref:E3 ubiquitin-protein ligase synoviolin-like TPR repeats domain-containing protein n=1 Tax=Plectus sambesii TaxID=2011161 RepID=A0A914VJW7_9BILA